MKKIRFSDRDKVIILDLLLSQYIKNISGDCSTSYAAKIHRILTHNYKVSSSILEELEHRVNEFYSSFFSKQKQRFLEEIGEIKLAIIKGVIADAKDQ